MGPPGANTEDHHADKPTGKDRRDQHSELPAMRLLFCRLQSEGRLLLSPGLGKPSGKGGQRPHHSHSLKQELSGRAGRVVPILAHPADTLLSGAAGHGTIRTPGMNEPLP